jgi:hypothetical protein
MHRDINEFKKGNQPITTLVEDKNGDLLAGRCKNYFCQLLNVHEVYNGMKPG